MDAVLPGCYARVAEGHKPPRISDRRSIARKHVTLVRIDVHDGKHLVYTSHPGSRFVMWWARADGGGQPQQIFESADNVFPRSFSPDGRRLAFHQVSAGTGSDLWTMPLDLGDPDKPRPGTPEVFLRTPRVESDRLSRRMGIGWLTIPMTRVSPTYTCDRSRVPAGNG